MLILGKVKIITCNIWKRDSERKPGSFSKIKTECKGNFIANEAS